MFHHTNLYCSGWGNYCFLYEMNSTEVNWDKGQYSNNSLEREEKVYS